VVGINISRDGVEISWEPGTEYSGPVKITATNMVNGDVGVMKDTNDGKHFVTWPPGTWQDHIKVEADDGSGTVIDEGEITVTVGNK
jgi:uncharacterized protein involved in tellurium resistance